MTARDPIEANMARRLAQLLTRKKFVRWLQSKRMDTHVGEAGEPKRCPLACYLSEHGIERPDLVPGVEVTCEDGERREFDLPDWADGFQHWLDANRSNYAHDDSDPDPPGWWRLRDPDDHVEAREALRIMREDV